MDVAAMLQRNGDQYLRTCLFADMNGPWDGPLLREAFQKYSHEWLGTEWHIGEFRQAMAAFFHEHIAHDPGRDGYSTSIVDAQAGRSAAVASRRYGNSEETIESMDPYLLEAFSSVSQRWHDLIGQDSIISIDNQFILPNSYSPLKSSPNTSVIERQSNISDYDLLTALRQFFNNPLANFKSPEQKNAIHTTLKAANDLLVVLPTGAGKSLIYLLPIFLESQSSSSKNLCTVVISPFISLTQDILQQCRAFDLYIREYETGFRVDEHPRLNLLVVQIDAAVKPHFWTQLELLVREHRLSRLVMDEVHVVLKDASYRSCFRHVSQIRTSLTPWLLLTATLAPKDEHPLSAAFGVHSFKIIRASTTRPNIQYHVREYSPLDLSTPAHDLSHPIAITVINAIESFVKLGPQCTIADRIIVYCPTIHMVMHCRRVIDDLYRSRSKIQISICGIYHGKLSSIERMGEFRKWREGTTIVMVATKAFGNGVDFPRVRLVLHYGGSDSLYDFAQQSGRAGRDGLPTKSITYWNNQYLRTVQYNVEEDHEKMKEWIMNKTSCRRSLLQWSLDFDNGQSMSETLPEVTRFTQCCGTMERCDVCLTLELTSNGADLNFGTFTSFNGIFVIIAR